MGCCWMLSWINSLINFLHVEGLATQSKWNITKLTHCLIVLFVVIVVFAVMNNLYELK